MVHCSTRQHQVEGIKCTGSRMLKWPQLHICPSSILLGVNLVSLLLIPASSKNPQCPEAERMYLWSRGEWLLKCKDQLPSSTPKTSG